MDPRGPDADAMQHLLVNQAIRDVLSRYCRAMDRIDPALGHGVWHPDGTAHYAGIYEGTGRGFVDWVCEIHRSMIATSHQVTNVLVQVDPRHDRAVSEAYVSVRLRTESSRGSLVDIVGTGRYLDRWSCRAGRWAIDHRDYVDDLTTTVPVPSANPRPTDGPLRSGRTGSDPSDTLFA